jgi:hypothetical protein
MKTIWKFPLEVTDCQTIKVPRYAGFLCVKAQNDTPVTYWGVDTDETDSNFYVFYIFGTGHPIPKDMKAPYYIDSVICNDGQLVWHIFSKDNLANRHSHLNERI